MRLCQDALFFSFPSSAWERTSRSSASRLSPLGNHLNQPRLPCIIACAGMPPMRWILDITAVQGVIVDILQLLKHHLFALNLLRMVPLLPKLITALDLVTGLMPF